MKTLLIIMILVIEIILSNNEVFGQDNLNPQKDGNLVYLYGGNPKISLSKDIEIECSQEILNESYAYYAQRLCEMLPSLLNARFEATYHFIVPDKAMELDQLPFQEYQLKVSKGITGKYTGTSYIYSITQHPVCTISNILTGRYAKIIKPYPILQEFNQEKEGLAIIIWPYLEMYCVYNNKPGPGISSILSTWFVYAIVDLSDGKILICKNIGKNITYPFDDFSLAFKDMFTKTGAKIATDIKKSLKKMQK